MVMCMREAILNFQDGDGTWRPLRDAKLLAFLRSPKGKECMADAVRAARGLVPQSAEPSEFQVLLDVENELRAASAQPLPPELAF